MPLILREFLRDHRQISLSLPPGAESSSPLLGGNEIGAVAEWIKGSDNRALIIISTCESHNRPYYVQHFGDEASSPRGDLPTP